jgi:integrase
LHLKPGLGDKPLQKLTPQDVQTFLFERKDSGLAARTVRYLKAVLRRSLNHALNVARNVAVLADAPRVEQREIHPPSLAQAKAMLEAVKGHRLEALFNVALSLGLRQGEVLGLRWADIDLKKGELRVTYALQWLTASSASWSRRPRGAVAPCPCHR